MGKPIDHFERIEIHGVKQAVLLQSADDELPILMVLHGGPGYAIMPMFHHFNEPLEHHFVVVNWDQRGAGRSFSKKVTVDSMNLGTFLKDHFTLIGILKKRFDEEKIFLLGHSWGSQLGLYAAKFRPQDLHAFFGVGQVVNPIQNEIVMYDWALSRAQATSHAAAITALTRIGRPDHDGQYHTDPEHAYEIADHWMEYFGGDLYKKTSTHEIEKWLKRQPVYRRHGKQWDDGLQFSSDHVYTDPVAWYTDFPSSVTKVEVPLFFLMGCHDYDTPHELVAKYYPLVAAPTKELVWFKKSAHFPFYEQPKLFNKTLVRLKKTVI
jgi:proline iminopeptidase